MFYLTTHSTHFIYGYMASDIWLRTILIVKKETRCRHIGYSYRLKARVLLYAPSHRQDNTYHGLCYISRGALAGTRNRIKGRFKDFITPPLDNIADLPRNPASSRWQILPEEMGKINIGMVEEGNRSFMILTNSHGELYQQQLTAC